MGTRTVMWIILGLILVAGGIVSSLRDTQGTPRTAAPGTTRLRSPLSPEDDRQVLKRVSDARPAAPTPAPTDKFSTGFSIDPIKGLRRKDENAEYFK